MAYQTASKLGVDLSNADAVGSQRFSQGETVTTNQDGLFVYCETIGTFLTGMMGQISISGTATPADTSGGKAAGGGLIGFIQTSSTSGQFAWFCQRGNNVYVRTSGTINASAQLYTAVTSGCLHTTSASSTLVGVQILANYSATATNAAILANLTWPRFLTNFG